jgi:hypothetical protein
VPFVFTWDIESLQRRRRLVLKYKEESDENLETEKIETMLYAFVCAAHHQHGLEACTYCVLLIW